MVTARFEVPERRCPGHRLLPIQVTHFTSTARFLEKKHSYALIWEGGSDRNSSVMSSGLDCELGRLKVISQVVPSKLSIHPLNSGRLKDSSRPEQLGQMRLPQDLFNNATQPYYSRNPPLGHRQARGGGASSWAPLSSWKEQFGALV